MSKRSKWGVVQTRLGYRLVEYEWQRENVAPENYVPTGPGSMFTAAGRRGSELGDSPSEAVEMYVASVLREAEYHKDIVQSLKREALKIRLLLDE